LEYNSDNKTSFAGTDLESRDSIVTFSVIFDMDGTLVDNTPYHFKSWQLLFKKYHKGELTIDTYHQQISGIPIMDTLRRLFDDDVDEAGLKALLKEKESIYKALYAPFAASVNGL
jgi:beta-phosphoglucomutase